MKFEYVIISKVKAKQDLVFQDESTSKYTLLEIFQVYDHVVYRTLIFSTETNIILFLKHQIIIIYFDDKNKVLAWEFNTNMIRTN